MKWEDFVELSDGWNFRGFVIIYMYVWHPCVAPGIHNSHPENRIESWTP